MTALTNPIVFNNSTGSDTLSSGSGPATAINDSTTSQTATTDGTAVVQIAGSPDLSGISAGDLLFVNTPSGRKYSPVASVDNTAKTITVDDNLAAGSGLGWAVGGKLSGILGTNAARFWSDDHTAGWEYEIEYTGTNYDFGAARWDLTANGAIKITGTGAQKPTVYTQFHINASSLLVFSATSGDCIIKNMRFERDGTSGAYNNMVAQFNGGRDYYIHNCEFAQVGNQYQTHGGVIYNTNTNQYRMKCIGCLFEGMSYWAFLKNSGTSAMSTIFAYNTIRDCIGSGVQVYGYQGRAVIAYNLIESATGGNGINVNSGADNSFIVGNIVNNTGGHGINIDSGVDHLVMHNIVSNNASGHGINLASGDAYLSGNAGYNNASGNLSSGLSDPEFITLTADPYVNAATEDFSINTAANGGALLRAAVLPMI